MEMNHFNSKNNEPPSSENEERSDFDTVTKPEELIKTFGSYTTLHGFHFLTDSGSVVRRILWLLLMIVCLAILIVQVKSNYAKLQRHDSTVTKDVEPSRSLLFPAVSICNQNMLQKSKILGTDAQFYLDGLDYLKAAFMNSTDFKRAQRHINASFDIEEVVKEAGHNLTTMLALCLWKGQICGPENFTSFLSFYRGLCYTFNSGAPGHPLLYATSSGTLQALSLMIDVQPKEYYGMFSYDATGIKVILHEQGEFPEVENWGIDVTPGRNTNIRIKRHKLIGLEDPFKPACGAKKLLTSKTYSASRCRAECNFKYLMELCKCRFLTLPHGVEFNVSNYCSPEELKECVMPKLGSLNMKECHCPEECEKLKYSSSLSSAYFPSFHFWDTVFQLLNISTTNDTETTKSKAQENIRKRLLKVNIFYESLRTEVTQTKPTYDIHDFTSDIGGNMGLFLGCSLLTLCEFLDLLIRVMASCLGKRRKHGSPNVDSTDTEKTVI